VTAPLPPPLVPLLPPVERLPQSRRERRDAAKAAKKSAKDAAKTPEPAKALKAEKPPKPVKAPKPAKPAKAPKRAKAAKPVKAPKPATAETLATRPTADAPTATATGPKPRKAPLYWRVLRLRHVHPSGWQRAVLLEGVIGAAVVLVLAGKASLWTLLVLPVVAALLVKLHDVLVGSLAPPEPQPAATPPEPAVEDRANA
jgi:cytoskeletal protein RodZ